MTKLVKRNNITSVVLVNNTAKTIDITPGTDIRWHVKVAYQFNIDDVARGCSIRQYLEAAATNFLTELVTQNSLAQNAYHHYPSTHNSGTKEVGAIGNVVIVEGGEILRFVWQAGGASTGGTDADGMNCQVLEEAI